MRRLAAVTGAVAAAGALAPAAASAHGLVGRTDLPIPVWLFGWAAAIVLVVSFVALGRLWSRPRLQAPEGRPLFRIPRWVDPVCGVIGVGLFVAVVWDGLTGPEGATDNFAPTFIYVHFWVGLVVLSVLFGNVFSAFNPWRAIARGAAFLARRTGGELPEALPYPEWLGRWPAVIGVAGFGFLELAYGGRDVPSTLALLALGYAAVQLVAMSLWGIDRWTERGDAFAVLYSLYARLSPLQRRPDGVVELRRPLSGAPGLDICPGTVTLLCTAVGVTTFDGFSNGPVWLDLVPHLQTALGSLTLASAVGLVGVILLVVAFYRVGAAGGAAEFAHTLLPIAFAYSLAHYFSLLVFQGQAVVPSIAVDYTVISATAIWYVQVVALVTGHVGGLVLGHDRALAIHRGGAAAVRSQQRMLLVMVGFTSLGLWLLSAVNA